VLLSKGRLQSLPLYKYYGIRKMERLFTKREVAEYLKISEKTVDRLIRRFSIPIIKIGHQVRISESSIGKMVKRSMSGVEIIETAKMLLGG